MNIWLIKASEDLPVDGNVRLARIGSLSEYLARQGHDVTWWTSTFNHAKKLHRYSNTKELCINSHEKLILLYAGCGYSKNVSLARMKYCSKMADAFCVELVKYEPPDIVLVCWPIIEMVEVAIKYGKKNHIPVIVDIRDQWPDSFATITTGWKRRILEIGLLPMIKKSNRIISAADGITSMSDKFVDWGCRKARRLRNVYDKFIPIGSQRVDVGQETLSQYEQFWSEKEVSKNTWNICLFTILTKKNRDTHTAIKAVRELGKKYPQIRFIIGGTGDDEAELIALAENSPSIIFAGWLNEPQMHSLMALSKCGMYCMSGELFSEGFGNKPIQYLSAGLPIVSSVRGYTEKMLEDYNMGLIYEEGSVTSCMEILEKLILNDELRRQMGKNAIKCFDKLYESEKINSSFEKHLEYVYRTYRKEYK